VVDVARARGVFPWLIGAALLVGPAAAALAADDVRELFGLSARAAIVVDARSGKVHYARNPTERLPPASTTKLLTALIALRETAPDELMRVSKQASRAPASKAYLRAGSVLTSRDLLYAVLLRSANDASVVIAEHIGGSVAAFARRMNDTAHALGAEDSRFVTPNGLPAPGHYSTAADLATLMRAALATPGMREFLSTPSTVIEPVSGSARPIALRSTNRLLWRDDLRVIGKTGYTRAAKRCFVGAASYEGHEVIIAVLGSRDLWGDVELLADYGLAQSAPGYYDRWRQRQERQLARADADHARTVERPRRRGGTRAGSAPAPSVQGERRQRVAAASARPPRNRTAARAAGQNASAPARKSTLRYDLHLGTFQSKARAEQVRRAAAKKGFRPTVARVGRAYRVSVEDFTTRAAAARAARTLARGLRVDPIIVASR
jgi:D-alanyl-D-alanine carboxypeptidase